MVLAMIMTIAKNNIVIPQYRYHGCRRIEFYYCVFTFSIDKSNIGYHIVKTKYVNAFRLVRGIQIQRCNTYRVI